MYILFISVMRSKYLEFARIFQRVIGLPRLRLENETFPDTCLFNLSRFDAQNSPSMFATPVYNVVLTMLDRLFVSLLTAESFEGNFAVNAKANIYTANFNLSRHITRNNFLSSLISAPFNSELSLSQYLFCDNFNL